MRTSTTKKAQGTEKSTEGGEPARVRRAAPAAPKHTRQTKQRQIRKTLLSTALELFLQRGFDAITVAEIADAAGMSRRSFFRYFPSKEELVFDWLLSEGAFIAQRITERDRRLSPLVTLRAAIVELAERLDQDRAPAIMIARIAFDTPALDRRFGAETERWTGVIIDILLDEKPLKATEEFTLRVQISSIAAAFSSAMRIWAKEECAGSLARWVGIALAALESAGQAGK